MVDHFKACLGAHIIFGVGLLVALPSMSVANEGQLANHVITVETSAPIRLVIEHGDNDGEVLSQKEEERRIARENEATALVVQQDSANAALRQATAAEAQVTLGWWTLVLSIIGTAALVLTLFVTRRALFDSRQQGRAAVRPYLQVSAESLTWLHSEKILPQPTVRAVNRGLSPALKVQCIGRVNFGSVNNYKITRADTNEINIPSDLSPNSSVAPGKEELLLMRGALRNLRGGAAEAFLAGRVTVFVHATVKYQDVFGDNHTEDCYFSAYVKPATTQVMIMGCKPSDVDDPPSMFIGEKPPWQ